MERLVEACLTILASMVIVAILIMIGKMIQIGIRYHRELDELRLRRKAHYEWSQIDHFKEVKSTDER